jgi:hypothetical protein
MSGRVTAIVPAPRLNELGRRCLERLLELPEISEVIFVPNEPEPDLDARVICLPSGDVPVGAKRQLGLERATGEIVALIDDDAYPHRSWLTHALFAFDSDPSIGAVCGPTLTPDDDPPLAQIGGRIYASALVAGPHRFRYVPRAERDVREGTGVNLILRREDALQVGLETGFYPGDDTVICDRLTKAGRRIRYVPAAIVFHTRRSLWRPHLLQVWRYGRHRGHFVRRFGGVSVRPSYFGPTLLLAWLLAGGVLPSPARTLWRASVLVYAAACVAAGADRRPGVWARTSTGIAATHAAYGVAFVLGLAGVRLAEDDR